MKRLVRSAALLCVAWAALLAAAPAGGGEAAPADGAGSRWYMAEGCTEGGMQTYILVLNPGPTDAHVDVTLYTGTGAVRPPELRGVTILPQSRATFHLNAFVTSYDVSTEVREDAGGGIVCERATYGPGLAWAHASLGAEGPLGAWYLAEGCTAGGFETWVLLLNPTAAPARADLTLMTGGGPLSPPELQGCEVPPFSRRSIDLGRYWTGYEVSTLVRARDGTVVCERATYGPGRAWATGSPASGGPGGEWYLAEGATAGGMETWVLVQNPNPTDARIDVTLMTGSGPLRPPELQGYLVPAEHRASFNLGDYVTSFDVSTRVVSAGGPVVAERAVYGPDRGWAHTSAGSRRSANLWRLAEGATWGDMETWILVQNPNPTDARIRVTLFTATGPVSPPALQGLPVPAGHRVSFDVAGFLDEADFGVEVRSPDAGVVVERSMYGSGREWGTCTAGSPL